MCPGHEPGMGTQQKPSWDKQGVVLSLTDETGATNQVPLYPGQGQSRTCSRAEESYPWYKEEWLAAGWQRASQNHRHICHGGVTLRGSCHQSCRQSHSSYSAESKRIRRNGVVLLCKSKQAPVPAPKLQNPQSLFNPRKLPGWFCSAWEITLGGQPTCKQWSWLLIQGRTEFGWHVWNVMYYHKGNKITYLPIWGF